MGTDYLALAQQLLADGEHHGPALTVATAYALVDIAESLRAIVDQGAAA